MDHVKSPTSDFSKSKSPKILKKSENLFKAITQRVKSQLSDKKVETPITSIK
jgi:hypothetical protein